MYEWGTYTACGRYSTLTSGKAWYHVRDVVEPGWVGLVGGVSQSSTSEHSESRGLVGGVNQSSISESSKSKPSCKR